MEDSPNLRYSGPEAQVYKPQRQQLRAFEHEIIENPNRKPQTDEKNRSLQSTNLKSTTTEENKKSL